VLFRSLVRIDVQDLETQVRDLEFVIAHARRFSYVSQNKLGVFGFDMGGMAGLILTMRNDDVDAFVSVSSGVLYEHPSGIPMASPDYDRLSLRVPWLHSMAAAWVPQPTGSESDSLFEAALHSDRYLLLTEGMGHADYTSYALIGDRPAMGGYPAGQPAAMEGYKTVSSYVSMFFSAFLTQDPESLAFLSQDPQKTIPGSAMTLEHRSATPASITYEEFVQSVIAGQAEHAIAEVRALQETEPEHILLQEFYLQRLAWSLIGTWGLSEQAMPVVKFTAELYPTSVETLWLLAESNKEVGDYPAAIEAYIKLLDQDPDNDYLKSQLEWLEVQ
jgi:dienelactone hydrolase